MMSIINILGTAVIAKISILSFEAKLQEINTTLQTEVVAYNHTTGQLVSGGALSSFAMKTDMCDVYSGLTNGSGVYTVTFTQPYDVAPAVVPMFPGMAANQGIRITSVSNTGCTVNVYQRNSVNLLSVDVLLSATVNVSGAPVDLIVIPK